MSKEDTRRCDEQVPYVGVSARFHQCRNRWRSLATQYNGEKRRVCKVHLRVLIRNGATEDEQEGGQND